MAELCPYTNPYTVNADDSTPDCLTLSFAPTPGGGGEKLVGLLSGQGSLSDWLKCLRYPLKTILSEERMCLDASA